jgi:hypothetical protein
MVLTVRLSVFWRLVDPHYLELAPAAGKSTPSTQMLLPGPRTDMGAPRQISTTWPL